MYYSIRNIRCQEIAGKIFRRVFLILYHNFAELVKG